MSVIFSGYEGPRHSYQQTLHMCDCKEFLFLARGTNMLACFNCGETKWLV